MAKKGKEAESGEQLELIDVNPENAKPLIRAARKYRKTITQRLEIQHREAKELLDLRELIEASGLQPLASGKIAFEYDGVTVEHTPQDAKVKVTIEE